jgi:hypothetical protein
MKVMNNMENTNEKAGVGCSGFASHGQFMLKTVQVI